MVPCSVAHLESCLFSGRITRSLFAIKCNALAFKVDKMGNKNKVLETIALL